MARRRAEAEDTSYDSPFCAAIFRAISVSLCVRFQACRPDKGHGLKRKSQSTDLSSRGSIGRHPFAPLSGIPQRDGIPRADRSVGNDFRIDAHIKMAVGLAQESGQSDIPLGRRGIDLRSRAAFGAQENPE